jgi:peptide/nickel transport system substrate-binding protein
MKLTATALGLCVTTVVLAGCGGGGGGSSAGGGGGKVVDGGTFTMSLASDPGNLDPQMGAGSGLFATTQFAYDALLSVDAKTGEIESALATKWSVDRTKVDLTLADGVTCAAGTVADNVNFVADPANQSPFLGTFVPAGAKATGDDAAGTVSITLTDPAPFVLNGLASLPMVCPDGLKDRKSLAKATNGTGPYELTEAKPGESYTFKIRDGYTWGPGGASTDVKGMPDTVVLKITENETTAANLLLSGELNAAQVVGPDAKRLEAAGLFTAKTPGIVGEQWYNQAKGRPTEDPKVRIALTQALDLGELQKVLTSGTGAAATTLAAVEPTTCPGDSVSGSLPAHDPDAAGQLLDEAGWTKGDDGTRTKDGKPLELVLLYQGSSGTGGAAATELAVQQWQKVGAKVKAKSQNETTLTGTIFSGGDWDISWVSLNVNAPDQLIPFLSGPAAPDGTNFAAIDNADYQSAIAEAAKTQGVEGCDKWLEAESLLFASADVVPFANNLVRTFGSGAEFATPGNLAPTSIRMMAK